MKKLYYILIIAVAVSLDQSLAQENIPVGTWRLHLSFNDLNKLAFSSDRIFAATEVGLIILDKKDQQLTTVSKVDGLSSAGISALAYDEQRNQLLIAFENGLINILESNKISVFSSLANASSIPGSRRINHITINGERAFLSTDFGVVVFDLNKKEVKETYRDLGEAGENLKINESVVLGDSLFLATEKGVLAGSTNGNSNLLDFRSWKRYNQGVLNNEVVSLTVFNDEIFSAISNQGILRLQNGNWTLQGFLQGSEFRKLSGSSNILTITTSEKVFTNDGVTLNEIAAGSLTRPNEAVQDNGIIWIADGKNGLISVQNGQVYSMKPNGPSANAMWRITSSQDGIVSTKGGFSSGLSPFERTLDVDQFINGQWHTLTTALKTDVTDHARMGNATFVASFGEGLELLTDGNSVVFDENNSPLIRSTPPEQLLLVPSIEVSSDGLWVANYESATPLNLLTGNSTWTSFSFNESQAQFPVELLVDRSNWVWMVIDPARGGGIIVFNKSTGQSTFLSSTAGKGSLPASAVRSLANDRDGQVWVGTDQGVVYFSNPGSVFSNNVDASRPIFENRYLLREESVTAIAVDGGNRKWLGTNNGVWLVSPNGEKLVYNFTEENSPLLSNRIISIAIDPLSGEVFFATDKGLCSYRSTATESTNQFVNVKIFPNPVDANFNGEIAINGLYRDAIVKITDISGRLIFETQANGGTATWNARQLNGNRVDTGMYLVFATAEDGSERHVGKIAVIK